MHTFLSIIEFSSRDWVLLLSIPTVRKLTTAMDLVWDPQQDCHGADLAARTTGTKPAHPLSSSMHCGWSASPLLSPPEIIILISQYFEYFTLVIGEMFVYC